MLTAKYYRYRFDSVIASISVTITITLLFPLSLFNKKNLRNQLNQEGNAYIAVTDSKTAALYHYN